MDKKYYTIITLLFSLTILQGETVPPEILELQKNEKVLVDSIYDHKDFAIELWNDILKIPTPKTKTEQDTVLNKIDKGIYALDNAIEISFVLNELQDQLITYYSIYNKSSYNLKMVKKNKKIVQGIIDDIKSLKNDFTLKRKAKKTNDFKQFKLQDDTNLEMNKWTTIPGISDKKFRDEIFNYYTNGQNEFINKKPVILIFYNKEQEPSINQLLNIEDIYEKYRTNIDFFRVSIDYNKELIKVFKVTELPTIYYLNMDSLLNKHVGTKGYYDIEQMIIRHFRIN